MISVSETIKDLRDQQRGFHGDHCHESCCCKKPKPKMSKSEAKLLIAYLRRLEKKATSGPWFQWTKGGDISSEPEDCIIMETAWTKLDKKGNTRATKKGESDIKFVIALRNNLPAILAALEERL